MTLLPIVFVLLATVLMAFLGAGKARQVAAEVEVESSRQAPKRWSSLVIVMTVVYFCLLLAGLSYAGWFRVA
jgi:uncharacterized membrane protein YidH (DUF202 family)